MKIKRKVLISVLKEIESLHENLPQYCDPISSDWVAASLLRARLTLDHLITPVNSLWRQRHSDLDPLADYGPFESASVEGGAS
jgi:hypothetical protein